jgi:hypothetical protein
MPATGTVERAARLSACPVFDLADAVEELSACPVFELADAVEELAGEHSPGVVEAKIAAEPLGFGETARAAGFKQRRLARFGGRLE